MSKLERFYPSGGTAIEPQCGAFGLEMLLHMPNERLSRRSSRNSKVKETPHA